MSSLCLYLKLIRKTDKEVVLNQRLKVRPSKIENDFAYFKYDIENIEEPWAAMCDISKKIMVEYPICHNIVKEEGKNLTKLLEDTYIEYIYGELGITNEDSPYIAKWEN